MRTEETIDRVMTLDLADHIIIIVNSTYYNVIYCTTQ